MPSCWRARAMASASQGWTAAHPAAGAPVGTASHPMVEGRTPRQSNGCGAPRCPSGNGAFARSHPLSSRLAGCSLRRGENLDVMRGSSNCAVCGALALADRFCDCPHTCASGLPSRQCPPIPAQETGCGGTAANRSCGDGAEAVRARRLNRNYVALGWQPSVEIASTGAI